MNQYIIAWTVWFAIVFGPTIFVAIFSDPPPAHSGRTIIIKLDQ